MSGSGVASAPYGVTTWTLPRRGAAGLRWASRCGFSFVHFDSQDLRQRPDQFHAEARAADIRLEGMSVVELEAVGLSDLPAAIGCVDRAIDTALGLGVQFLYLPSFGRAEIVDDDSFLRTCRLLRRAVSRATGTDVVVATENVLSIRRLRHLMAEVGPPGPQLLFDTQNLCLRSIDPTAMARDAFDFLGGFVHVKDGGMELGSHRLGRGHARVEDTIRLLLQRGYGGRFVLESDYRNGDEVAARFDQAFLDRLVSRVSNTP